MYAGKDFSPMDVGEEKHLQFDFAKDGNIAAGDTLAAPVAWTAEVAADSAVADPSPSAILSGVATYDSSGSTTQQFIVPTTHGVKYVLTALVTTSSGEKLSLWSHLQITVPS